VAFDVKVENCIGKKLDELKEEKGISRQDLAEKIGCTHQFIYKLSTAVNPSIRSIIKINTAIRMFNEECQIDDLIKYEIVEKDD
jgi:transcriptional regulator with XRE-family HTH domain